ncbi:MAG TPA: hypothetical protein VJ876_02805 [Bacteroidales bacterium]|nr:hypothetical protein [Bacteroidales bacterium]
MKRKRIILLVIGALLLVSFQFILIRNYVDDVCQGVPYLTEHKPGKKPVIYCHKIISTDNHDEYGIHFSSDAKTLYFIREGKEGPGVMHSGQGLYGWTRPRKILLKKDQLLKEACFYPDEKRLLLVLREGSDGSDALYISNREAEGWSPPEKTADTLLGPTIGSLSISGKGNIFYSGNMSQGTLSDILITEYRNQQYMPPWNPGANINTPYKEMNPFISPDESYLLFSSDRPGGYGGTDLYISIRLNHGEWAPACNLGPYINSEQNESRPYLSPDGKYLFFSRSRLQNRDLYWVSSEAIETYTPLTVEF